MAILRVQTVFSGATGSPWINTLYFSGATAAPTQGEADGAVAATGAFWSTVDARIANEVSWSTQADVGVIELTGVQTGSFATTSQTGSGAAADSILPFTNQGLVRLLTGVFIGGRQIRGRIFVPGLTEINTTDGVLDTAALAALNGAAATLNALTSPILVVWSRRWATAPAVTAANTWNQLAVLRSRRD